MNGSRLALLPRSKRTQNEQMKADLEKLRFAEINANMTKNAKERAEAQLREAKQDVEHWRSKAQSFDRDEERMKRQVEDVSRLEREVKELHEQNLQLLTTFQQFKSDWEVTRAENQSLQETLAMSEMSLDRASEEKAQIMGHVNPKFGMFRRSLCGRRGTPWHRAGQAALLMDKLGLFARQDDGEGRLPCLIILFYVKGWSSVQLGPKDGDNGCEAKLTVVLRPGSVQNCIDEVNSEVIFVSIGEPSKKGRPLVYLENGDEDWGDDRLEALVYQQMHDFSTVDHGGVQVTQSEDTSFPEPIQKEAPAAEEHYFWCMLGARGGTWLAAVRPCTEMLLEKIRGSMQGLLERNWVEFSHHFPSGEVLDAKTIEVIQEENSRQRPVAASSSPPGSCDFVSGSPQYALALGSLDSAYPHCDVFHWKDAPAPLACKLCLSAGMERGGLRRMHIRHSHDTVSPVFEHGKHGGKHVKELVDDLLSETVLPEDLTPFVCIKFGEEEYWAVFGNRRLKALKSFQDEVDHDAKRDAWFGEVDAEEPMEPPQPPDRGLPEEPTPKDDAKDSSYGQFEGGEQGTTGTS
eukprot:symbB.v1.2.003786.t2/scaffold214.1/size264264/8